MKPEQSKQNNDCPPDKADGKGSENKTCGACWGSGWESQFVKECSKCNGTGKNINNHQ